MQTTHKLPLVAAVTVALGLASTTTSAGDHFGGHVGAVMPLLSHSGGVTTIGHSTPSVPLGLTLKTGGQWAFDMEIVSVAGKAGADRSLLLHPGAIRANSRSMAVGFRAALMTNGEAWGFTPLVNRSLVRVGPVQTFAEGVMPVRFQKIAHEPRQASVGFGIHVGVGF